MSFSQKYFSLHWTINLRFSSFSLIPFYILIVFTKSTYIICLTLYKLLIYKNYFRKTIPSLFEISVLEIHNISAKTLICQKMKHRF